MRESFAEVFVLSLMVLIFVLSLMVLIFLLSLMVVIFVLSLMVQILSSGFHFSDQQVHFLGAVVAADSSCSSRSSRQQSYVIIMQS